MTIHKALQNAQEKLRPFSDAPDLDADRLLLDVLDRQDSSWLVAHFDESLSPEQVSLFGKLIDERCSGKPLAYILGAQEFYGRDFFVNENVLIPRPDTEKLVEIALGEIDSMYTKYGRNIVVADVGTGSGCIAITLLLESKNIERIVATDISKDALSVAKKNAERYGVLDRVSFVCGDMFEALERENIDLIVSNPPYVPTAELDAVPTRDTAGLRYEPRGALDGGVDGSVYTSQLLSQPIPVIFEGIGGEVQVRK